MEAVGVETSVLVMRVVASSVGVLGTIAPVTAARTTCTIRTTESYVKKVIKKTYHNGDLASLKRQYYGSAWFCSDRRSQSRSDGSRRQFETPIAVLAIADLTKSPPLQRLSNHRFMT